jgi:hypothetical protein
MPRKKLPETRDRRDRLSELQQAWEQIEATRAEVEVLRKAMVVLTEDQRANHVLKTLLPNSVYIGNDIGEYHT